MTVAIIKASFQSDISRVWDTVTDLKDHAWRSDLSTIRIINEEEFIEVTKDGFATTFRVTLCEPHERWVFDMENDNMKGHWSGEFCSKGEVTEVIFTEDVCAKKLFLKPFVGIYLKKQQERYIADLKKALE